MARAIRLGALTLLLHAHAAVAQPGPPSTLASLFNAGANIGFSVIRAAYSPQDQRPPQAAADWMLRDMANAKQWAAAVRVCVPFDPSRFDAMSAEVQNGAVAARLLPQFEQLYRDYQVAVRSSLCSFGLPSTQNVEAFFVAAVITGFATARASYFVYPTPLPAPVVSQIRQDFSGMRLGLPAATACLARLDTLTARIDQIERSADLTPGQAVYADMVGLYQQIEQSAGTAACAGRPPAAPATSTCTPEVLIRTSCANVCAGAGVLLGVVQGSPECLACVNRGCSP